MLNQAKKNNYIFPISWQNFHVVIGLILFLFGQIFLHGDNWKIMEIQS